MESQQPALSPKKGGIVGLLSENPYLFGLCSVSLNHQPPFPSPTPAERPPASLYVSTPVNDKS